VGRSFDKVASQLYQGSKPPPGKYNVDLLVLMAEEYQPHSSNFPGVAVVHAGIDDAPRAGVKPRERRAIHEAAAIVGRALREGKSVLVTCNMGLNRSGVVSALGLRRAYPTVTADQAIGLVRNARGMWALSNPHFEQIVRRS
jgi:protein-tyrosine phosphatase